MKKAISAFYGYKRAFGSGCGQHPHIIHWMYTAVVMHILTYGEYSGRLYKREPISLTTLNKVQRLANMGTESHPPGWPRGYLVTTPLNIFL